MKKALAMLLSLSLMLCFLLVGCGGEPAESSAPPEESPSDTGSPAGSTAMTDGIYEETTIGMKTFYRFNEDGTYYALFFGGSVVEAGTYEVTDKETEYREEGTTGETAATLKSSQTVVTTSYQGVVTEIAYADDTLQDCNLGGMAGYRFLHHNAEYSYDAASEEQPLPIYTFYADNLSGNSLTLYHNKTFIDYTGDVGVEGTWEKTSEFAFSMTDENGNTSTLAIDGDNAVYNDKTLSSKIVNEGEPIVINTYRVDETEVGLPMPVALRIDCYDNSTCKLIVEVAAVGQELEADNGTYELDELMYSPTFHFTNLGDIACEPDFDHATESGLPVNIPVKGEVETTDEAGTVTTMTLDAVLTGTATADAAPTSAGSAKELTNSFKAESAETGLPMPVDFHIDCFSDGTCTANIYVSFTDQDIPLDAGTFTVDEAYGFHFQFEAAGAVEGEPDYATATADNLTINVPFKLAMDLPQEDGSVIPLDIDLTASGPAVNAQ